MLTPFHGQYALIKLPPVERKEVLTEEGETDLDNPKNHYNFLLDRLIERVAEYSAGKQTAREAGVEEMSLPPVTGES
jgi:hypothetical protein